MATEIILPALGMAQDTGKIVRWLKSAGEPVSKGEPVVEIETDKATVEIEAPASGILADVTGAVALIFPLDRSSPECWRRASAHKYRQVQAMACQRLTITRSH